MTKDGIGTGMRTSRLQAALLSHHESFRRRLTLWFRDPDLVHDAMQQTYIRLAGIPDTEQQSIQNAKSYVLKAIWNSARDLQRKETRSFRVADAAGSVSSSPPANELETRLLVRALVLALDTMPERRRALVIAARLDGLSQQELMLRFNLSRSTVQKELQLGMAAIAKIFD